MQAFCSNKKCSCFAKGAHCAVGKCRCRLTYCQNTEVYIVSLITFIFAQMMIRNYLTNTGIKFRSIVMLVGHLS